MQLGELLNFCGIFVYRRNLIEITVKRVYKNSSLREEIKIIYLYVRVSLLSLYIYMHILVYTHF